MSVILLLESIDIKYTTRKWSFLSHKSFNKWLLVHYHGSYSCQIGAAFGKFLIFGSKFTHIFKFSRPKRHKNSIFWASKLVKIYFCAQKICGFSKTKSLLLTFGFGSFFSLMTCLIWDVLCWASLRMCFFLNLILDRFLFRLSAFVW